jgi:hypothetical protein
MRTRIVQRAALGAALALVVGGARASESQPDALPHGSSAEEQAGPGEITGRFRAGSGGLSLDVGGAHLELRISDDALPGGEPFGSRAPGAHDFRASFSVDGKTTNLLLQFVPPPGMEAPGAP